MKTIELFAGTRSFSMVAKALGHETFTTDYEELDGQDLVADVTKLKASDFPYQPDVLWASPPCEGFSVASIGANWGGGGVRLHTQELNGLSFAGSSESYPPLNLHLGTEVVVYRKPTRGIEESTATKRSPFYAHDLVLPVWGHTGQANQYLDKCPLVQTTPSMQELPLRQSNRADNRPTLSSRISTPWGQNWYPGYCWLQGSIPNTSPVVRGYF